MFPLNHINYQATLHVIFKETFRLLQKLKQFKLDVHV